MKVIKHDFDIDETRISDVLKGTLSFRGAQYFDEIMHEEIRPKKIVKFRVPKKPGNDF